MEAISDSPANKQRKLINYFTQMPSYEPSALGVPSESTAMWSSSWKVFKNFLWYIPVDNARPRRGGQQPSSTCHGSYHFLDHDILGTRQTSQIVRNSSQLNKIYAI